MATQKNKLYQSYYQRLLLLTESFNKDQNQIQEFSLSVYDTTQQSFIEEQSITVNIEDLKSFKNMIKALDSHIFNTFVDESISFIFCTYGKELFFRQIPSESTKENFYPSVNWSNLIFQKSYYLQFIDIRHELFLTMAKQKPHIYPLLNNDYNMLLPLMCKELQIEENKQQESAIKAQQQVFQKILHYVCSINDTQLTTPVIISTEHIYGQQLYQRDPWYNTLPQLTQEDSNNSNSNTKHFFKLRGIPFQSREKDIQEFFNLATKMEKEDIALIYEKNGQFSGEAVVQVHGEKAYLRVKSLNLKRMGARYIEILDCSQKEFQSALDTQQPSVKQSPQASDHEDDGEHFTIQTLTNSGLIRLRGLPFRVTTMEIAIFFAALKVDHKHVKIIYDDDGRPSGEAFVIFERPEWAEQAKQVYHRKTLGHRYIEVQLNQKFEKKDILELPKGVLTLPRQRKVQEWGLQKLFDQQRKKQRAQQKPGEEPESGNLILLLQRKDDFNKLIQYPPYYQQQYQGQ